MLHITNGDSVAGTLRLTGLPGRVLATPDVLHEGPCPTTAAQADWRKTRARYLADAGYATYDAALEQLAEEDRVLQAARTQDEVVLWFEHDLYDQLLLLRLLAWFAEPMARPPRLSLICIGSYPGFRRFDGLGQLSADQLAGLFPSRTMVTAGQLALGADAWARFGSADPTAFAALLEGDTTSLPFLAHAVRRQLEEFPWTRDGLSRSERQALTTLSAGQLDLITAFLSAQKMETHVFMGDLLFFRLLRALGDAGRPLVTLNPSGTQVAPERQQVALTALGRDVLAGRADHASANGLDRWIGGVHLSGRTPTWRWDPERGLTAVG